MKFIKVAPHPELNRFIEYYWIIENDDPHIHLEKIIPDGYTELIFHYRENHRTDITGSWQTQSKKLLAGQITKYFHLQNTGPAGMIGIKLKPTALSQLFGIDMMACTDRVIDLDTFNNPHTKALAEIIPHDHSPKEIKNIIDGFFLPYRQKPSPSALETVVDMIFAKNGMLSITEITEVASMSERHLERLFKQQIGLTPKFYTRIIRFNYIFQLIKKCNTSWNDIVYLAGYYDQSHFIRNFKAFTGEDPSTYYFERNNIANFFLKK